MKAVAAVQRDLATIAETDPALATSALAAAAMAMAREVDNSGNSATSMSMCANALLNIMNQLRELMPKAAEKDGLDDLSARRAVRIARGSAAKG